MGVLPLHGSRRIRFNVTERYLLPRRPRLMKSARLLAMFALLTLAVPALACTIPVFRYALERWELTPYEVVVFHKEPLPGDVRTLLTNLERGQPAANVAVHVLEVDAAIPKGYRPLYEKHGKDQPLPWVAVRVGDADPQSPPAWSGPLSVAGLKTVLDSPARRKIVDHLRKG